MLDSEKNQSRQNKWIKNNVKRFSIDLTPKYHYLFDEFFLIEGENKTQKIKTLIEFYNNHKGKQK